MEEDITAATTPNTLPAAPQPVPPGTRRNKRRIMWLTNAFAACVVAYVLLAHIDTATARECIQWAAIAALSATGTYSGFTTYENIKKSFDGINKI